MLDRAAERVEERWLVEEDDESMEPLLQVSQELNRRRKCSGHLRNAEV
jgi:predicted glycosyl hydrolase (DUF1957 family)